MKRMIGIIIFMVMFGFLLSEVATKMYAMHSQKKPEVGLKYYPMLYRLKEKVIYPAHNKEIVKSRENGINGAQVTKIRSGYKVKK